MYCPKCKTMLGQEWRTCPKCDTVTLDVPPPAKEIPRRRLTNKQRRWMERQKGK